MVDIPNDVDLVDYDGDDEENPEEDPKEDRKCFINEDIEDEDVEIKLDDDAELIFPHEIEDDKTPPP
ncbi:hypothetical protein Tco_1492803 [Tanacetum coccineum]